MIVDLLLRPLYIGTDEASFTERPFDAGTQVNALMEDGKAKKQLTIDLQAQTVTRESGESYPFDVRRAAAGP